MNAVAYFLVLQVVIGCALDQPVTVTGVVMDPEKNVMADAEVFLVRLSIEGGSADLFAETTTDRKGEFGMDIAQREWSGRVYYVFAKKERFGLDHAPTCLVAENRRAEVTLQPAESRTLTVVDPAGNPVPHARLQFGGFKNGRWTMAVNPLGRRFDFVADEAGNVTVNDFSNSTWPLFWVESDRFAWQRCANAGKLQLRPAASIRGRVTGPDGCDTSNLAITAVSPDGGRLSTTTNRLGEFEFSKVLAGEVDVEVQAPTDFDFDHWPVTLHLNPDQVGEFELRLNRFKTLVGCCRNSATQEPLAGARVTIQSSDSGHRLVDTILTTDANGFYRVRLIPGWYRIRVPHLAGFVDPMPSSRNIEFDESFADGSTPQESAFDYEPAATVEGVVLDEQGQPISEATVTALWNQTNDPTGSLRQVDATSNDRGEFKLVDVWRGGPLHVTASTSEASMSGPIEILADRDDPLELRLSKDAAVNVSGRIVDTDGRGVSAVIRVMLKNKTEFGRHSGSAYVKGCAQVRSDENGDFVIPRRLARWESYHLKVGAARPQPLDLPLDLSTVEGPALRIPDIVLEPRK